MKVSAFRSFLFGCLAMAAVAFGYTAPASADFVFVSAIQTDDGLSDNFVMIQPADAVLTESNAQVTPLRSVAELGPIHPVYQLSWRTAAHSLTDYHLRC